jgi:iron complex outermembrane receptor protein
VLLIVPALLAAQSVVFAQSVAPDLSELSIEDLMNIEVTSASRREQRVADIAAAVFVITQDDIHRSGMTTIPDVLRLVPGVQVAQINSNKWAVTVRGFNGLYANKLLVLVDGRSLYTRFFSGVFWDAEDVMLDDVDRIEVIRGPSAAMWGANAVNGVINIVTKSPADTQGMLVRVDAGRFGEQGAIRYGGRVGAARYRVYSQWTGRSASLITPGIGANDASHSSTTGFRTDWTVPQGAFALEGAFTAGQARALWPNLNPLTAAREPLVDDPSDTQGGHMLSRWTRTRAGGASMQIQSFVDISARQEPVGDYRRRTFDVDTQYHARFGSRHDVVGGAGYRHGVERFIAGVGLSLIPAEDRASLWTAFVQDEIGLLGDRVAVTIGSQVQHDAYSGFGVQPTARVLWKVRPKQRLWAAGSRALRTPSIYERGLQISLPTTVDGSGLPLLVTSFGNPAAKTENFVDVEGGYRLEVGTSSWIAVTGFFGGYDHLRTTELDAPVVEFVPSPRIRVNARVGNLLEATTRGFEAEGHWTPIPNWHLAGSYTAFDVQPTPSLESRDPLAILEDGRAARSQWHVRSSLTPSTRTTLDINVFNAGRLEQSQVDGYTRVDLTAAWRFSTSISLMAIGQNLFNATHTEFGGTGSFVLATQVPRSANLRLRWTWR